MLGRLLRFAADVASELGLDAGGYRVVTNTGKDAGQSVDHLHFHSWVAGSSVGRRGEKLWRTAERRNGGTAEAGPGSGCGDFLGGPREGSVESPGELARAISQGFELEPSVRSQQSSISAESQQVGHFR